MGCLLGRDVLDALGAVLNFGQRTLQCTSLFDDSQRLELKHMAAGHFMLELLPESWPRLGPVKWRRCGLDGVLELQLTPRSWLERRVAEGSFVFQTSHDHLLTETSIEAGKGSLQWHESCLVSLLPSLARSTMFDFALSLHRRLLGLPERLLAERPEVPVHDDFTTDIHLPVGHGCLGGSAVGAFDSVAGEDLQGSEHEGHRALSVESVHPPPRRQEELACKEPTHSVRFKSSLALFAFSISLGLLSGAMASPGTVNDQHEDYEPAAPLHCPRDRWLHCGAPVGAREVERPMWLEDGICGGQSLGWISCCPEPEGSAGEASCRCLGGDKAEDRQGVGRDGSRDHGSPVAWTKRWFADLAKRLGQVGALAQFDPWTKGDGGSAARPHPPTRGHLEEQEPSVAFDALGGTSCRSSPSCDAHVVLMVSRVRNGGTEGGYGAEAGGMSNALRTSPDGSSCPGDDEGPGRSLSSYVGSSAASREPGASSVSKRGSFSGAIRGGNHISERCGHGPDQGRPVKNFDDLVDTVDGNFKIHGKVKKGISQMISQAWHQHRRDQIALSVGLKEIKEVFMATWNMEMRDAMNETFAVELRMPTFLTEVYTDTEPVAQATRRHGLVAGESLTLGTGWDFRLPDHCKAALAWMKRVKPYVVVLAFPCGAWSQLLALNASVDLDRLRSEAFELVFFAIEVARLQLRGGRHYLMENPRSSMAWKLEIMEDFVQSTGALEVVVDMCRFGLRAPDGELHKKATKLVTSMQALVSAFLDKRCLGDHRHTPVIGGKKISTAAGHYTKDFADAVVDACMQQYDFENAYIFKGYNHESEAFTVEHEVMAVGDDGDLDSEASFEVSKDDEQKPISAAVKNAVYRLHVNTSHRSNQRLAKALLICGAPKEAVLAAKRLKCPVCAERRNPKPRPVASLPPPRDVGQQVHLDLVMLEDSMRNPYVVAHATDNVSRYQAAKVLKDKSTASVIYFLQTLWIPLLGRPHTIVADQGREFVSAEFGDWCDSQSIYLYHIGVGAPWQNGICERSGATLKALVGAVAQSHAIGSFEEMELTVGEAVASYNSDLNEGGVAPIQLVTGKIPSPGGDVLNSFNARLSEHSLIEAKPTLSKLVAIRETARLSMIRLHYSRGLRQAELSRSRATTGEDLPQPGDLVFFWRAQKYQSRKDVGAGTRRRLMLRRWHGPGLLVATEGRHGTDLAANCFVSFCGQLTKCPLEHVRKASSLESIAAGSWEAAIDEVINAAKNEARAREHDDGSDEPEPDGPLRPSTPEQFAGQLQPSEIVAALQPPSSAAPSLVGRTAPPSLLETAGEGTETPGTAAPGTPVPSLILQASQSRLTSPMASSTVPHLGACESIR